MKLTPREKDKLMVSMAANVARKRLERGVKLNYPEAIALITDFVIEGARDGKMVSELMETGAHVVKKEDCMDGIPDMIPEVQVEATFPDGTNLALRSLKVKSWFWLGVQIVPFCDLNKLPPIYCLETITF